MKAIKYSVVALGLILMLAACERSTLKANDVEAIIVGQDVRLCGCCGGYLVALGNNPNPPYDSLYQWDISQEQLDDLPSVDELPHLVRIDYTLDTARCEASLGWMDIRSIEVLD